MLVAAWLAAVARQPVKGAVLYEATLHRRIQGGIEGQGNCPGRVHLYTGGSRCQLGRGGQQLSGLGRWYGDDHPAERAMAATIGVLQVPVMFAAKYLGNSAGEVNGQVFE
ncbi:hypothetical protein D3C71_1927400 [compost metagenome]